MVATPEVDVLFSLVYWGRNDFEIRGLAAKKFCCFFSTWDFVCPAIIMYLKNIYLGNKLRTAYIQQET
jgi:hypothetical protein